MNPYIVTFLGWLLRASWQAAALAILVMAAQALFRKTLSARWRYSLWLLVLARLALPVSPPSPTSIFNYARFDRMADRAAIRLAPPAAPAPFPEIPPAAEPSPAPSQQPAFAPPPAPQHQSEIRNLPHRSEAKTAPQLAAPERNEAGSAIRNRIPLIAASLWLAGVLFLSARVTVQNAAFLRRLRDARELADPETATLLDNCRRLFRITSPVPLFESAHIGSPALYGLFAPRMLLPTGLRSQLTREELRHVFLHELAHLKRRDMAVHCLSGFLHLLNWFNPVLWFAFRRMAADRELACDELALSCAGESEKCAYGQTIIKLLEQCSRPAALPGLVGILEDKDQMRRRILMIAGFKPSRRWSLLAAAILAVLAVVALTDAQVQKPNAPENYDSLSKTWSGTVLLPNGQPAAGAGVSILCMQPGFSTLSGLSWPGSHSPGLPLSSEPGGWADAAGRFSIFTASNATAVLIADPQGFAMIAMDAFNSNKTVTLEPWGEITGRLLSGSTSAPNTRLAAVMTFRAFPGQRQVAIYFDALTDAGGLFHFTNIPPGALDIGLADWMTTQGTNIHFRGGVLKTVAVQPGTTVDLTLDAANALSQPKSAEQLKAEREQAQMQAQTQAQMHKANELPDPEPPLSGIVLLPDGKAAEGARVVRWGLGIGLQISNAAIWAPVISSSQWKVWATNPVVANTNRLVIADSQGRFTLPEMIDTYANSRTQWVFATRLDGYASATAESVKASRPMTLQPWGRIEGTLRLANKPVTNAQVRLDSSAPNVYTPSAISANTDEQGRFVLSNVPSERFTLFWNVRSGPSRGESGSTRPIDVRSGVVTTIALGELGRPVIGKLVANSPAPGLDWTKARLRMSSSARSPIDSLYFQPAPSADGSFRFDDMPPGTYELSADFPRASTPGFTVAKVTQQITVAEVAAGRTADAQDLGDIKMKVFFPWETPKVGDTIPPIELTDLSGKPVKLEDFRGKYILARFLGPFDNGAGSFAAAIARAYRQDGRLVVVTVGYTPDEITRTASTDGMNNGDPCIYAYSGLPESDSSPHAVTMLIAPDGKVIATGLEGAGIRDAVMRALGTGQTNQIPRAVRDDSITGTVLLPNGKPAASATVAVSGNGNNPLAVGDNPGDEVELNGTLLTTRMSEDNIKVMRDQLRQHPDMPSELLESLARTFPLPNYTNGPVILADAQGKFRIPAKKIGQYLFASHPGGFAAIGPGSVESHLTIQLKAWGFVAGIALGGDSSQTNVSFALRGKIPIPNQRQDTGGSWYQGSGMSPDSGGRFTFTNVVPGEYEVERLVTTHEGATTTSTGKNIAHLLVKPGEVTPLLIDEKDNPSTNTTATNPPPAVRPSSRAPSSEPPATSGTVLLRGAQPAAPPTNSSPTNAHGSSANPSKLATNSLGLSLEIRCTNEVVKVGDEISIQFTLSNHGTKDYKYQDFDNFDLRWGNYSLSAKTASGARVPDPRLRYHGYTMIDVLGGERVLYPGESTMYIAPLNHWALIQEPGRYEVAGEHFQETIGSNPVVPLTAPPITITVLPRTKEEMHDYVAGLTNQIAARLATNGMRYDPELDGFLKKLMYTCSPDMIPTILGIMFTNGILGNEIVLAREALMNYAPHTEETRKAIFDAVARHGLNDNMNYFFWQYDLVNASKEEIKPLIQRALSSDNPGQWSAGARLAGTFYDDSFTKPLIAIASGTNTYENSRVWAIGTLARNRSDGGVKALKALLRDPDPAIWSSLASAITRDYYNRAPTVGHVTADDFDANELTPFILKLLDSTKPEDRFNGECLADIFGGDALTPKLVALATASQDDAAILALALNRTDEGVKTLKTLLNIPYPYISSKAEYAIRYAYTSRRGEKGTPLRLDDFDAKFQQPETPPPTTPATTNNSGAIPSSASPQAVAWGEPVQGLQVGLSCADLVTTSDRQPLFDVHLRNRLDRPLAIPSEDSFISLPRADWPELRSRPLSPQITPLGEVRTTYFITGGVEMRDARASRRILGPEETVVVSNLPLSTGSFIPGQDSYGTKTSEWTYLLLPGGKFRVAYVFESAQTNIEREPAWHGKAASGELTVTVRQPAPVAGLEGSFQLPKTNFFVGELIYATLNLRSTNAKPVSFANGGDFDFDGRHTRYSFTATDESGRPVPDPLLKPTGSGGGPGGPLTLKRGETFSDRVLVNLYLNFTNAGHYTLVCHRTLSLVEPGQGGANEAIAPQFPVETKISINLIRDDKAHAREIEQVLAGYDGSQHEMIGAWATARDEAAFPEIEKRAKAPGRYQDNFISWVAEYGEQAVPALLIAARSSEPSYRSLALSILSQMKSQGVPELVKASLGSPDARERAEAVLQCSKQPVPGTLDALLAMGKDPDPLVRRYLGAALGASGDDRAVPVLLDLLHDANPDPFIRIWAAGGLSALGHKRESVPIMIDLLRTMKPSDGIGNVIESLKGSTGQDLGPNPAKWIEWWQKEGTTNTTPTNPPPALPPSSRAPASENSTVAGIGRTVIGKVLLPSTVANDRAQISLESADWPSKGDRPLSSKIAADGTFRVDNVPAGEWGLLFMGAGAFGTFTRTLVIPEMPRGPSDEPLDAGTVEPVLVTAHSPQIGETLPLFKVKTTHGGTFNLADQRGHFVLLDFEPLGFYPESASVQEAWSAFGTNDRLSVLTLVVQPMSLYMIAVAYRDFPWPQTHLRDCPWYLQYPLRASLGLPTVNQFTTTPASFQWRAAEPAWQSLPTGPGSNTAATYYHTAMEEIQKGVPIADGSKAQAAAVLRDNPQAGVPVKVGTNNPATEVFLDLTPPTRTPPVNTNDPDRNLPGALLIGPDGNILARDLHGAAIKTALAKALGPK
jgi:beta-lactamase regulating signal transducer with metallopeptidase domain/HEAT repeat protein/peroxiredoxin